MSTLKGHYYANGSSVRHAALLRVSQQRFELLVDNSVIRHGVLADLSISSRLGNIPRRLTFTDGHIFESSENDAIDQLIPKSHDDASSGWLHKLESNWPLIAVSVVMVAALLAATVKWGIPQGSKAIAHQLPVAVTTTMSEQTLSFLDELMLQPSKLPLVEKALLRKRFRDLLAMVEESEFDYKLHFRSIPGMPNAFALPSGDIILTDELVALADNDWEIDSVLLHEIGHVEQRHALQRIISGAVLAAGAAYMAGDLGGSELLLSGMPVFLVEQSYSRGNEAESDHFAFERMMRNGRDPACFGTMMMKLQQSAVAEEDATGSQDKGMMGFLESHPDTDKRIEAAFAMAEGYVGQRQCP